MGAIIHNDTFSSYIPLIEFTSLIGRYPINVKKGVRYE